MASGKFDLSDNQAYQWAWVTYEEKNSSIANNTSDLLVNVYFRRSNNGYTSSGTMSTTVTVDGTPKSASKAFSNSGTADSLVFSQTFTGIKHNTNGSKSVAISVSASGNQGFSGSGSKTVALDTIKRASVINSFRGNDIEGNFNVVYTSYSSSFTHKLRLSIKNGNIIETFNNYKSGTDVYFSNENVEYLQSYMESLPSVELSAVVETWDGSTKIGESTALTNTFSVDNALPIITATVVDVNDKTTELTNDPKILVKYYSNAKATMSAEAQKGAAINESLYIIRNGSENAYGTEHTFNNVESNEFLFSAEDTRGNVGTATEKPTMIDYVKLTCNIANNRPDALGNMTVVCNGDYFNNTFGAVANTLTVQYRYTTVGSAFPDNWVNMNTTITGNSYIAYADFNIPDFVQTQAYSFETRAIDKLDTVSSSEPSVKSTPIFHWGENDFVFEVPVTFKEGASGVPMGNEVDGDLAVTGNLRLKGSGNYGNALLLGDGTHCYISEPEDDVMHIKAANGIHLISNEHGVYVDGNLIPKLYCGTWTPSLNASAVSSYTTQYGWYSKMNQTVTVGFFIKANCNTGYSSTLISISGLPYTPLFASAGGGMCSKACISGGYTFQCFVAETSGNITVRIQASNNTANTNLATSASGCAYPSGGGEITLSGTITYMSNT